MAELKTCGREGCAPIEQTRGDMRPGDYHDVIMANQKSRAGGIDEPEKYGVIEGSPEAETANPAHVVEMSDGIRGDVRICCKTCGCATGWNKADAPGMPGVGRDYVRKVWNERTLV
jgi:hypothetical protein